MDIAKHDRAAAAAAEAFISDSDRTSQVRERSRAVALAVFRKMEGRRQIDISLELGANCPWHSRYDKELWKQEINRLEAEGARKGVR